MKTRFSSVKSIPRTKIFVDPLRFQGRQGEFAEDTVNAIVQQGFDKNLNPIIVWYDAAKDAYAVLSGHSRWEASRRLFDAGDKSLAEMNVKEFKGDEDEAIDYAVLESNRDSTQEGLKSDIAAYKRAVQKGWNKERLLTLFKPESRLRKLQDLSYLNPNGRFLEFLDTSEEKSFPYLERNASWVGQLRATLPRLTDQHENELFDYLYRGDKKALTLTKDKFFNLVDRKVNSIVFNPDEPLNLSNIASANPVTDPINDEIKNITTEMERLVAEQGKNRDYIVRARNEGQSDLIPKFEQRISDINKILLRKQEERDRLQKSIGKVERATVFDLFAMPPAEEKQPEPAPKQEEPQPEETPAPAKEETEAGKMIFKNGKVFKDGKELGTLEFTLKGNSVLEIDKLYLDKSNQKKGIGREILKQLFQENKIERIEVYPLGTSEPYWYRFAENVRTDGVVEITRNSLDSGLKEHFADKTTATELSADAEMQHIAKETVKAAEPKQPAKTKAPRKFTTEQRSKVEAKREAFIEEMAKKGDKLTEAEVLVIGRRYHRKYRSAYSQTVDESSDSKRRLSPTPENLIRWMKAPGKFDLIGVDTFRESDATADYKSIIAKQKVFNLFGIKV